MRAVVLVLTIISFSVHAQVHKGQHLLTNKMIHGDYEFYGESVVQARSLKDGKFFTTLKSDRATGETSIDKFTYETYEKVETVLRSSNFQCEGSPSPFRIEGYSYSADEKKLLLENESESIYRYSTKSYYYIWDLEKKTGTQLSDPNLGKQSLAQFSPNGNNVAFVRKNNVFVKDLSTGVESQVTRDGKWNEIINGATDWVYEEEFSFDNGIYWSPDGKKLAFYRMDESKVKEFQLAYYGSLYPYQYRFKYPKAGEANSVVSIHVYDLQNGHTNKFDLGSETDIYIPRIKWTKDPDVLCVTRMNRSQNHLELLFGNCAKAKGGIIPSKVVYSEESTTYIDVHENLIFLAGNKFLWTSEKDGFNHVYCVNPNNGKERQITSGEWEVTELLGVNDSKDIYYLSTEKSPLQRHLYSVKISGKKKKLLSQRDGQNEVKFSAGMRYYINYNSAANSPEYITLHSADGKMIKELVDNQRLTNKIAAYATNPKEFFSFETTAGISLNGWMVKPIDFDENKKYPLLMYVYGGPGHNTVNDSWEGGSRYMWWQLLAQKGYVVASVDARGTGARGKEFKHCTYKQLGRYETVDQIEAAKFLGKKKFIDDSRIGIFGWSYGGYMSSLCITKGADVFKTAIAVAPVTNWRFYDNIYTERFMGKPQDNGDNYDVNSPINHVEKLKGNYLLIHGAADDNVHYQNSLEMVTALVNANKQFDLFIYPNKNHSIYGGNTRLHLYDMMTDYLLENL